MARQDIQRTIQEYVPGKKNPFSSIDQKEEENTNNETTENGGSTTSGTTNSSNSTTGYLPDKGTK